MPGPTTDSKTIEMRRQQADQAIQKTAHTPIRSTKYRESADTVNQSYDTEVAQMTKRMQQMNRDLEADLKKDIWNLMILTKL